MKKKIDNNEVANKNVAKMIGIGVVIFIVLYFVPLTFLMFYDDNLNYEIVDDAIYVEKDKAYIKVTNSYYDVEDKVYIIESYLENNSLDDYISLSFNLYDKDGVVLGSAIGDVTLNKEDKRYKIKSVYYDNDAGLVSSYKITDIYGN